MSATLVMVGFQQGANDAAFDLIPGPRGQAEAEQRAAALLAHWRSLGNPVVHLRFDSMDPASPFAAENPGNNFIKELAPQHHEPVVEIRTHNGFVGSDLMQVLEEYGSSELVICGLMLEGAVESTLRMAGTLGFMVYLPADCTASRARNSLDGAATSRKWSADEVHELTLCVLDGEYAKVLNSDDLMAAAASHPNGIN